MDRIAMHRHQLADAVRLLLEDGESVEDVEAVVETVLANQEDVAAHGGGIA